MLMEPTKRGHIRLYLRGPLYMAGLLAIADIILFCVYSDWRIGAGGAALVGLYTIAAGTYYAIYNRKLREEIMAFAVNYGTVQRYLLHHFQLPYALLDESGRFLWMNGKFCEDTGKEPGYSKSVTTIFPEITREVLAKLTDKDISIKVKLPKRHLLAQLKRLEIADERLESDGTMISLGVGMGSVVSLMLFDETELDETRQLYQDQKLVAGLIYIDNYEETFESVEDVKRSMLTAIIDRKISRYFRDSDAIIRKLERDKYFMIFQQKYLPKLEESKFSILEDIKNTKAGNENEITLSIGIGVGANSYAQSAEYARAAIDLALGRGGAQAVIKDSEGVSYYGMRGREVEKTTRVKSRVKAQALREMMEAKEKVIVMGHKISDEDAFGAAIGVYCAARQLGKPCHIVLNTITATLRPLTELFTVEAGYPDDMIINSGQALEMVNPRTLVMVVDTNRPSYTECPELLRRNSSIVVFDHHRQGDEQIQNPILSYVEPYASSACEMIAETLQYFSERIRIEPREADCIYAGILIDTNNFMTKTGVRTFEAAAYLKRIGAEVTRVRKMLREDMSSYKARAEVVRNAEVYRGAFAISVCDALGVESPTVVAAQAANELLNIVGIKSSIVLTKYAGKIYVSARSIDEINVREIMVRLGGGGHINVAGAQIEGAQIEEARRMIKHILDDMLEKGEIEL